MLEAARRISELVLEVEGDATRAGQRHTQEMCIRGAIEVGFNDAGSVGHPGMVGTQVRHGSTPNKAPYSGFVLTPPWPTRH